MDAECTWDPCTVIKTKLKNELQSLSSVSGNEHGILAFETRLGLPTENDQTGYTHD